jgi:uncharacterized membrane protein SpoIIM required for sporulation
MTRPDHDQPALRHRSGAASAVVWNTVMPALGLALILGASLLPAIAIAGAAALMINAVLGGERPRRRHWRPSLSAHVASDHTARGI